MAKIDKQILVDFSDREPQSEVTQFWPIGSKLLKLVLDPKGIYTYFEVPNILSVEDDGTTLKSEEWEFAVIFPGASTKDGDAFLDIITAYTEVPPAQLKEEGLPSDYQAVIVFTIYLRKRPSLLKLV